MSRREVAIDLGTANTLVFQQDRGIVYNEPTVVAMNSRTGEVLAAGRDAWELVGRSPGNLVALRPLSRGVITDFEVTQQMLRLILRALDAGRFVKPRVLVCVPAATTEVERRAVEDAVVAGGAKSASLVDQPLAAAIGAGLPIHEPVGSFVVDVGGGTTEMAVLAMGGVVNSKALGIGGFDMDAAIRHHVRKRYGVGIGENLAEHIKFQLGSAYPAADAGPIEIRGRQMSNGMPTILTITPEEIRETLADPIRAIVETTRDCLAESPPELAHDVLETGLFLTGGGGMLRGLDMRLAQECEVPVHVTEQPLTTVVVGAGHLLEYMPDYRNAFLASRHA
jgi:rod shape-determining protein MreB and related proteins